MESVAKARDRLAKYPLLYAKCSKQGALYAHCVLIKESSVKKDDCAKEFADFKRCLQSAAKDSKIRI